MTSNLKYAEFGNCVLFSANQIQSFYFINQSSVLGRGEQSDGCTLSARSVSRRGRNAPRPKRGRQNANTRRLSALRLLQPVDHSFTRT